MNVRTLIPLVVLVALSAIGARLLAPQWQPTEADGRLTLPLDSFAPGMREAQVLNALKSPALTCVDQPGFFMGARVCQARLSSYLEVPALFVAFFFKDDGLTGVKVDVPNAQHRAMGTVLLGKYGPPTIDGKGSNGLVGWKLPQGRMVYNRDRDADPTVHNTVLWVSEAQAAAMGGL